MALFDNLHFVILKHKLEERDDALFQKLGSHCATFHPREFLAYKFYVLRDLHNPYLIFATLGLDRDDGRVLPCGENSSPCEVIYRRRGKSVG